MTALHVQGEHTEHTETALPVTSYWTQTEQRSMESKDFHTPAMSLRLILLHSVLPPGHPRLPQDHEDDCLGYSSYPAAPLQVYESNSSELQTYATYMHTHTYKQKSEPQRLKIVNTFCRVQCNVV